MHIGIDASRAVSDQRTGTENYSFQLIAHLVALLDQRPDHSVTLYCNRAPEPGTFAEGRRFRVKTMRFPRLWTHLRLSLEMALHAPGVLFVPAHVIPIVHPKASVATIHDLGHLSYPEAYPPGMLKYLDWATRHNVKNAAHLLADSEAAKGDVVEHFGVPPEGITVVYPGVSSIFRPAEHPVDLSALKAHYGIRGDYILYVGTLQPRKNVERLLEAFAIAKREKGLREQLVLVGRKGWLPEGIIRRLEDIGESVTLAGYVPDSDLPLLYSGATLFVLPSLFEGFGMPVVEAMACGTPVLAADASSLPEVVGNAGALFNPHETEQLAQALAWICDHPEFRAELRQKGLERAREFTWEQAALRTLEVLERVGGSAGTAVAATAAGED